MVCQFLAKFDGHWCCSSRDMVLVCHLNKHDHVIKGSGDYKDKSPSRRVTILLNLVAIGTLVVEI